MRPVPGELLHFSEDPTIRRFLPHVARTARPREPLVWAVDELIAPAYWFPRQCPRAMAWARAGSDPADVARIIGPGGGARVHAVEYSWLDRMRTVELFAYRLPADGFVPMGTPEPHAWVRTTAVSPLGPPQRVPDLFARHEEAGIQLRVLPRLGPFWTEVVGSSLAHSGIRLGNARPDDRGPDLTRAVRAAPPPPGSG